MSFSPASKKQDKRYRRQDLERRRDERKWFDPATRRENHARRPGQGHARAQSPAVGREER